MKPDIVFAGSEAMDSMSMERGFVHWHGDVDYTDKASSKFKVIEKILDRNGSIKESVQTK